MTNRIEIPIIQADIIFKALHYVARNENIEIPSECNEIFKFLSEYNPNETYAENTIDVMEYLSSFIKSSKEYEEYYSFVKEEQSEDSNMFSETIETDSIQAESESVNMSSMNKITVFEVYDNHYINKESAQYIIDTYGNPLEIIVEKEWDNHTDIYIVVGDEQIELDMYNRVRIGESEDNTL
ncbi:MAG: hypothetical protein R3267_07790 [Paenisporosarcina sp.]|nr:hypothetical protein [Paenisporosarcina sp.]